MASFLSSPTPKTAVVRGITGFERRRGGERVLVIAMSSRRDNRRQLQKGRNMSTEAIHAVQSLKRASLNSRDSLSLTRVFESTFHRLLKFDMMAVLRELLRQNHSLLALQVFQDIRKEEWYKPKLLLYVDMIKVMASSGLVEEVELLCAYLKSESGELEPDSEGFNAVLRTLMSFEFAGRVLECYSLMTSLGCEPDRPTLRVLIRGLESMGESGASAVIRQDAQRYYGESLHFLEEDENDDEETVVNHCSYTRLNQLI